MTPEQFHDVVARARLAPSIHNAQPARWQLDCEAIHVCANLNVTLPNADPTGHGIGLSCGAAVEATVLALSEMGIGAKVTDVWDDDDRSFLKGHRLAACIIFQGKVEPDGLTAHLADRFTWRGPFAPENPALYGWTRADTALVCDRPQRDWLAMLNDAVSLPILRQKPFRTELMSWMRLTPDHPRLAYDGMGRDALVMTPKIARKVALGFGPLWPLLNALGRTKDLTAEAPLTRTAPVIACFHRPKSESAVTTGRAYLRLWLEATALGLAGCPMAALSDTPEAAAQIAEQFGIPPDRKLIQVIRFGVSLGQQPARARRPIKELIS